MEGEGGLGGRERTSGGVARGVRIRCYLGTGDSGRGCDSPHSLFLCIK